MVIENIDSIGNYIKIQPIKAKFSDNLECNILTAHIIDDNMTNSSVFKYCLYNLSEDLQTLVLLFSDTIAMTGNDYTTWNGDNEYAYTFITATKNIIPI